MKKVQKIFIVLLFLLSVKSVFANRFPIIGGAWLSSGFVMSLPVSGEGKKLNPGFEISFVQLYDSFFWGVAGDWTYDRNQDTSRYLLGPEIGGFYELLGFGVDGGWLYQKKSGYGIRPFLTLNLFFISLTTQIGFYHLDKKSWQEITLMIKLSLPLHDM